MDEIKSIEAIRRAGAALGLSDRTPGRAWRVRYLQRPGEAYFLVVLGEVDAALGVACVDPTTSEIEISASLPGVAAHITVEAMQAKTLVAGSEPAEVEMVWMPCEASRSPLYPLWEVKTKKGIQYVDQQGRLWSDLRLGQPGG
jgi:hypothetical protein